METEFGESVVGFRVRVRVYFPTKIYLISAVGCPERVARGRLKKVHSYIHCETRM